jgi:hypothetical protein
VESESPKRKGQNEAKNGPLFDRGRAALSKFVSPIQEAVGISERGEQGVVTDGAQEAGAGCRVLALEERF